MFRLLIAGLLALLLPAAAQAQMEQQTLVDRATLSVQELFSDAVNPQARGMMKNAKAVVVCPQVFKAGFILGGQGGTCVLSVNGAGVWSSPAFYSLISGSIGFQIGVQDSQIVFIVLTDRGLTALMESNFKVGADASVAVATIGAGVSGATTAAMRADIIAFSQTRGLFAGIALDGSVLSPRDEWNQLYYGQSMPPKDIVLQNRGNNPGADPLRETLAQYSAR